MSVDITGVATVHWAFVRSIVRAGNTARKIRFLIDAILLFIALIFLQR